MKRISLLCAVFLAASVAHSRSILPAQRSALEALRASQPGAAVQWRASRGTPAFINGLGVRTKGSASEAALAFVRANGGLFGIADPDHELALRAEERDPLGNTHARLAQRYHGLPVWGGELTAHVNAAGVLYCVGADVVPTPSNVPTSPAVGKERAAEIARAAASAGNDVPVDPELGIAIAYGPATLAYRAEVEKNGLHRWIVFIDATTGAVIHRYNDVKFLRQSPAMEDPTYGDEAMTPPAGTGAPAPLDAPPAGPATGSGKGLKGATRSLGVYQTASDYRLVDVSKSMFNSGTVRGYPDTTTKKGQIVTASAHNSTVPRYPRWDTLVVRSASPTFSDASAVDAHFNCESVYDFYKERYDRTSYNDSSASYFSVVHYYQNYDNAGWTGKYMEYGDGDSIFTPLAGGLDVCGHELTHAVTERTSQLAYEVESGAINEAMSDIMGTAIENKNWELGEDVTKITPGFLRNHMNPHLGVASTPRTGDADSAFIATNAQPATMREFIYTLSDNGGVHTNSGIINRAAYLVARGYDPAADTMGRRMMADVFYGADVHYLTEFATFSDCRTACIAAAQDRGYDTAVVAAAFDSVGIVSGLDEIVTTGASGFGYNASSPTTNMAWAQLFGLDTTFGTAPFVIIRKISFDAAFRGTSTYRNTAVRFDVLPDANFLPGEFNQALATFPETLYVTDQVKKAHASVGRISYQFKPATLTFLPNSRLYLSMQYLDNDPATGAVPLYAFFGPSGWKRSPSPSSRWIAADSMVSMSVVVSLISDTGAYRAWLDGTSGVDAPPAQPVAPGIAVYPNPATERATIVFGAAASGNVTIDVVDESGRAVLPTEHVRLEAGTHALVVPTAGLRAGTYFAVVRGAAGAPMRTSFVIAR